MNSIEARADAPPGAIKVWKLRVAGSGHPRRAGRGAVERCSGVEAHSAGGAPRALAKAGVGELLRGQRP